jgi:predicted nucleic acid-binding protein
MNVILDTNVFDDLLSGRLSVQRLLAITDKIFVTHIQLDELNMCPDSERRGRLLQCLIECAPRKIPTESFVVGFSRIGSAKIGDGNLFENLHNGSLKSTNDALIAETAFKNKMTLLTNDKRLYNKMISLGGEASLVENLFMNDNL